MRTDQLARTRALARLAKFYPKKFKQFLNHEREQLGLPAVGVTPPGPRPKLVEDES